MNGENMVWLGCVFIIVSVILWAVQEVNWRWKLFVTGACLAVVLSAIVKFHELGGFSGS